MDFALDDLVGFLGKEDFVTFAKPYVSRLFGAFPAAVRFFHNDAQGLVCAPHLHEMGINLFNFSFQHSLERMRELAGPEVTLLGNVPPRDVMALGTPEGVRKAVAESVAGLKDLRRVIVSVGGRDVGRDFDGECGGVFGGGGAGRLRGSWVVATVFCG